MVTATTTTTITTPYGTYTIGTPRYAERSYGRTDVWTCARTDETEHVYVHVADKHDLSPWHSTYPGGYHSGCSCCYLNFTHSVAKHTQALADREAGRHWGKR